MKTLTIILFHIVLLPLSTLPLAAQYLDAPDSDKNSWSFDVAPYLWLANINGTFSVPGLPAGRSGADARTDNKFSTGISAVAMLTARLNYGNFGLLFDGAWLQLKTEGSSTVGAYSDADIRNDIGFAAPALAYRLPDLLHLKADLFAGARVWYFLTDIRLHGGGSPAISASSSRVWADPIVGANLRYDFSRSWFASVRGDAGGFGAGSGLAWTVFGGVGYSFTDWFSTTVGYRYMHADYNQGQFKVDADLKGLLLALAFHF